MAAHQVPSTNHVHSSHPAETLWSRNSYGTQFALRLCFLRAQKPFAQFANGTLTQTGTGLTTFTSHQPTPTFQLSLSLMVPFSSVGFVRKGYGHFFSEAELFAFTASSTSLRTPSGVRSFGPISRLSTNSDGAVLTPTDLAWA
jgi:hypothetical protein